MVDDIQVRAPAGPASDADAATSAVLATRHRAVDRRGVLHGREAECAALDGLIDGARDGHGTALVLRGAGGIGTSALLRHALARGTDMTVLRAVGVDAEAHLPYAGLHQLLRPALGRILRHPTPLSSALRTAMGLEVTRHDELAAATSLVALLAGMATRRPLLVVVDDAHRLDRASRDALLFAARRVDVAPIAAVLSVGDDEDTRQAAGGVPELRVTGLGAAAAAALLDENLPTDAAPHVRTHLLELADGNPLALLELPRALSAAQLAGRETLPDPLPVGRRLRSAFLHGVDGLSTAARRLLLVAATERVGDVDLVLRVAAALGCDADALGDLEAGGVVVVDRGRLRFRRPLTRSAVYTAAGHAQRRAVHAALGLALDTEADEGRSAWHRAAASIGRDGDVAIALERSARRALDRSGFAAAATSLERAADLTPEPAQMARRLVAAAAAAWDAGQLQRVDALVARAAPFASDATTAAGLQFMRARRECVTDTTDHAVDLLLTGAEQLARSDPERVTAMVTAACMAAWSLNDHTKRVQAARRTAALAGEAGSGGPSTRLLQAFTSILRGDMDAGTSLAAAAASDAAAVDGPHAQSMAAAAALFVGDDVGSLRLLRRAATEARSQGGVALLLDVLSVSAVVEAWTSRIPSALAHATEGLQLAEQIGHDRQRSLCQAVLAWTHAVSGDGDGEVWDRFAVQARRPGQQPFAPATAMAAWATGLRSLGEGRPEEAHVHLSGLTRPGDRTSHPMIATAATGDIVEAAVRAGDAATAQHALDALERFAAGGRQPWALAIAARCRGMICPVEDAERHLTTALEHHANCSRPFEHGRTLLTYGSWLRRRRRRIDARLRLRAALQTFEQVGAAAWEARTRGELRASGATVGCPERSGTGRLTAQELHIVHIVREGATNKQIAERLYLSPRTIDYHLRKVFVKLGLSSRAELITLAPGDAALAAA